MLGSILRMVVAIWSLVFAMNVVSDPIIGGPHPGAIAGGFVGLAVACIMWKEINGN